MLFQIHLVYPKNLQWKNKKIEEADTIAYGDIARTTELSEFKGIRMNNFYINTYISNFKCITYYSLHVQ